MREWLDRQGLDAQHAGIPGNTGIWSWGQRTELALLRIGYFIDWLDSRAGEPGAFLDGVGAGPVQMIAMLLSGRCTPEQIPGEFRVVVIPLVEWDHVAEYSPDYHAQVAGHLSGDEIPVARPTYERLRELEPTCLSALVNLAELDRRAGDLENAQKLLTTALAVSGRGGRRHGCRTRNGASMSVARSPASSMTTPPTRTQPWRWESPILP